MRISITVEIAGKEKRRHGVVKQSILDKFSLDGKKAVITGGYSGLGKGMAEALVQAGAVAVLVDISEEVNDVAKEISPHCCGIQANMKDRGEVKSAYAKAIDFLHGIDILVNCAGIQRRSKCEEFPMEYWDDVMEINLTSVFEMCQLAGRDMIEKGRGKIINIASMLSFFGGSFVPAYAASKGGVAQLTKALANEWACKGINVNAIAPGYMDTGLNTNLLNDKVRYEQILLRIPAGRWGTPEDVKGVAVFLASEASDYLHGAIIPVDGGYLGK